MFSVGDKVKVKILPYANEGTIIAAAIDESFYVVEFVDKNGENPFTYSYQKHELIKLQSFLTKCECGAGYSSAPLLHSRWCPRWSLDSE